MNAKEATQIWAKKKLDAQGISYSEDDVFSIDQNIGTDGCCDMCYSSVIDTSIVNQRWRSLMNVYGDIEDILEDIMEIATGEGN